MSMKYNLKKGTFGGTLIRISLVMTNVQGMWWIEPLIKSWGTWPCNVSNKTKWWLFCDDHVRERLLRDIWVHKTTNQKVMGRIDDKSCWWNVFKWGSNNSYKHEIIVTTILNDSILVSCMSQSVGISRLCVIWKWKNWFKAGSQDHKKSKSVYTLSKSS